MNLDDALEMFLVESRELLEQMEAALLALETSPDDEDAINAVFRAAHTIKGSAGLFNLDSIVDFTHVVESVLDRVRTGSLKFDENLGLLMLQCGDHIAGLIEHVQKPDALPADMKQNGDALMQRLNTLLVPPPSVAQKTQPVISSQPSVTAESHGATASTDNWHISLRFGQDVFRQGLDPMGFLRYLSTVGEISHIETLTAAIPYSSEMDPESCYLGFEISLQSSADKKTIESVFEFVKDDCDIRILPPHSMIGEYVALIRNMNEREMRLGEMLVSCGTLTEHELEAALLHQTHAEQGPQPAIGELLIQQSVVQPPVVEAALEKQKQIRESRQLDNNIRIDARKLDQLISLVGELIIAGASTQNIAQRIGASDLLEATSTLSRLVAEVRDSALNMRMVPIGGTFNRFQRVVRDISRELDKDIELIINGAETELDKTVVEKISDPLMHLVRNAIDHGIESPATRLENGKSTRGTVTLNASHDSGNIIIEVSDDGAGLDRDRIFAKAVERRIIDAATELNDAEICDLIFEPGFSTAAQVTNISGRGVGMDVVRRNIQALRGTVEVESHHGSGSLFRIRLPLTLAIIDGFQVGVGTASYVLPLDVVVECIENAALGGASAGNESGNYFNLRGEVLPYIRLRDMFDVGAPAVRRENIVVVQYAGRKAGLVVDTLMGELQAVIRPQGPLFSHSRGIGGFTILGSGEVALILDVHALATLASGATHGHAATADESKRTALLH